MASFRTSIAKDEAKEASANNCERDVSLRGQTNRNLSQHLAKRIGGMDVTVQVGIENNSLDLNLHSRKYRWF